MARIAKIQFNALRLKSAAEGWKLDTQNYKKLAVCVCVLDRVG